MKNTSALFNLKDQHLRLLPQKAVYWQEENSLLLTDLHIGKSGHFRKQGIAVPGGINTANLNLLTDLIRKTNPVHLIILGDLFHSDFNKEWEQFKNWRQSHSRLKISLVKGNHDILAGEHYRSSGLECRNKMSIGPFLLSHEPDDWKSESTGNRYMLSGHLHPAVKLRGKGRQSLKLPCFYFGKKQGILPAFGKFTGTHILNPGTGDRVFAIAGEQVMKIH